MIEAARAMLIAKELPKFLWTEAIAYACYIRNRTPTRAIKGTTPYEQFWGKKPNVAGLHEFGMRCWILQMANRDKLSSKSTKHIFTGLSDESKAYRYFNANMRQIQISRNVIFEEFVEDKTEVQPGPQPVRVEGENQPLLLPLSSPRSSSTIMPTPPSPIEKHETPPPEPDIMDPDSPLTSISSSPSVASSAPSDASRQSSRLSSKPRPDYARMNESGLESNIIRVYATITDQPQSLEEVKSRDDLPKWQEAMDTEIRQLQKLGTYGLTTLPQDRKAIGCRWVYNIKCDANGNILKYKARLVAQGFSQIPGQDFRHTYSPVMRIESFRALVAYAVQNNYVIQQVDVVGAYLNGTLTEEIYMKQPPGYDDGSGRVSSGKIYSYNFY